jgi:hypothetical protein
VEVGRAVFGVRLDRFQRLAVAVADELGKQGDVSGPLDDQGAAARHSGFTEQQAQHRDRA